MYDRIPAQFVESVPGPKQAESKICTELRKEERTGEVLFRTGNRIKKERRKRKKKKKKRGEKRRKKEEKKKDKKKEEKKKKRK